MNPNSPESQKNKIARDHAHQLADKAREESKLEGYKQMKESAIQVALHQLLKDKNNSPPSSDQS
jgi:hypothetical protein